jgi:hypothetical protein
LPPTRLQSDATSPARETRRAVERGAPQRCGGAVARRRPLRALAGYSKRESGGRNAHLDDVLDNALDSVLDSVLAAVETTAPSAPPLITAPQLPCVGFKPASPSPLVADKERVFSSAMSVGSQVFSLVTPAEVRAAESKNTRASLPRNGCRAHAARRCAGM